MTLGFSDKANLGEGPLWPIAFALKDLTAAEGKSSPNLFRPKWARTATQSAPQGGSFSPG